MDTRQRCPKTQPTSEREECPSKASKSPYGYRQDEKWPKPWCQVNEVEAEQATSTVATENKLDQLFDWRRYSTFNRIRNFIAHYMRFKTKQRGTLKADDIHQAEQIMF